MESTALENENKKFIFITHQMDRSGAPTSLLNIMEEFKEKGYGDIETVAMRGGEQTQKFKNLSKKLYIVSDKQKTSFFDNFILFFKLIWIFWKTKKTKLVLINSSVNLRAMSLSVLFRKKVFVYVRESEKMHESKLGFLRKRILALMSGVICVSHHTKEWVIKYVPESKLTVLHNGIKIDQNFSPERKNDRENGKKLVGIIGYLDFRKGVDRFYDLAKMVLLERDDTNFIVIGEVVDHVYKQKVFGLNEKYPGRLEVTGIVENVHPYIQRCDVVLMLSREEALPRVVMEASYNAVPVLALDVAGTKEMLPTDYGFLISDNDVNLIKKKLLLLLDIDVNQKKGMHNLLFVKSFFNREKNIKKLVSEVLA